MKKLKRIVSLLMVIAMLSTTSFGATFTKVSEGNSISINVDNGKTVKVRALEIFGKIFNGWTISGATVADRSQREIEITMGTSNVTATANYVTPYTITVNQTANGIINPGTLVVGEGTSQKFTIAPDTSHMISDVLVDGTSLLSSLVNGTGDAKTYTLNNIQKNHTITAIFSKAVAATYTITYNANGGAGTMAQQAFSDGVAQNLATNTFTKNGYAFSSWNTKQDGTGTSYQNGVSYTATANITLYAQWTPVNYTISYNLNGGTVSGNPITYTVESNAITLVNPTKDGYNFTGWTGSNGTTPSTTVTIPKGSTGNRTYTANWESTWVGWNKPVIATGLTPVNWNGSAWETTTVANWNYNYNSVATATHSTVAGNGDGKWANAQTADGSLYVWIPRYSYKITSGEHAASQKSWNSLTAAGTAKIEVKFSNGTVDDTSNSYIKHPAFTFGTDELEGIWVAKYEASQGNTTSQVSAPTSSTSVAKSIPGVASWRNISVSNMFDYAYNTYRNADSHLMKNVEWGAVAYLTNAIGRIPYINNSSDYITGNAGGSQDAGNVSGTTNAWNTAGGVKASTTHNVYGIYDMSGGSLEYVAAYHTGGSSSYISSLTNAADKYVDRYSTAYSASKKGDAVYETSSSSFSSTSWDGDYSHAPSSGIPVFARGGGCGDNSDAGVFSFSNRNGYGGSNYGFRVVLGIR